ncbi:8635_t:CDS:2, partial [Racocetra fulgida]
QNISASQNDSDISMADAGEEVVNQHEDVVALLQRYFNVPNGYEIADSPIIVSGQPHGLRIAPDIAVRPNKTYVPRTAPGV